MTDERSPQQPPSQQPPPQQPPPQQPLHSPSQAPLHPSVPREPISGGEAPSGEAPGGLCARCAAPNPLTRSHCAQCGARLPWLPASKLPAARIAQPEEPTVKLWPFWAGEAQKLSTVAAGVENFYPSQWCLSADKKTGLAIDEGAQRLCLLTIENDHLQRRLFGYPDLLGSEVVEDGYILASTSGSSASSVGGLGQLPRGLSQKVRSGETVKIVAFKLVLNALVPTVKQDTGEGNAETLIHIVKFLAKDTQRGSGAHKAALDKAQYWHRLMMAFMHIQDLKTRPLPVDRAR